MAYDYDRTHESILNSAARHFLEVGFPNASIRQICKAAGVTNGAFYAHFRSKEDLFAQLVEPALQGLQALYERESGQYLNIRSAEDILSAFRLTAPSESRIIRYIYANGNAFRLLLQASGGTEYANFPGMLTEAESSKTQAFFAQCRPYVRRPENLSGNILTQVSSFVVTTVFDCFLSGCPAEETIREAQLASEFCLAGLRQIWGI